MYGQRRASRGETNKRLLRSRLQNLLPRITCLPCQREDRRLCDSSKPISGIRKSSNLKGILRASRAPHNSKVIGAMRAHTRRLQIVFFMNFAHFAQSAFLVEFAHEHQLVAQLTHLAWTIDDEHAHWRVELPVA
jgi:hypothetical protein